MSSRSERTTLITLGSVAGALLVAIVVVLVIYLVQSAPNTEETSAPASSASSSPAAPPPPAAPSASPTVEPATDAAEVSVTGTGFTITDASGDVTFTHEWADESAPAVAALTELFGAAPTDDFQNGDSENYAYDIFVWPGFRLYDVRLGEGNRPRAEVPAPTFVSYDANTVGEATIADEFGIEIGMTSDEVRALGVDVASTGGPALVVGGPGRNTFYQDGSRSFPATVTTDMRDQVASVTYGFRTGGL